MKALPTAASNALTLATTPGSSPLTAQSKAQRLRTHAQEKRGPGGSDGFKDHLRTKQRGGSPSDDLTRPAHSDNGDPTSAAEGAAKPKTASDKAEETQKPACIGSEQAEAAEGTHQPQTAEQAAKEAAEPYIQEIVAQVLQGVDPALKFKLTSMARTAGTVSGNASAAMRSSGGNAGEQLAADGADAAAAVLNVDDVSSHNQAAPSSPHTEKNTTAAGSEQRQADGKAASSAAAAAKAPDEGTRARAGAEHATAAVDKASAAINPAAVPVRGGEQRITLTPTLTAVPVGGVAGTQAAPQGGAEKAATPPPPPPPPPPVAQQVEHGLKVAMRDLPAPAGDRLVTLKLNPSALGTLRIAMHVSGDAVQVRFQVGSAKAKDSIGKTMEDLKAAIGRQGLRVESMEVEEDRALAALSGPSLDENGQASSPDVSGPGPADAGKGFAQLLDAPHGPDGPRAADAQGRTPVQAEAEYEGGVLQVLTFRLDAVG